MAAARQVTATTLVKTHNWLGRTYLAIIMPFHRLIVRAMLRRLRPEGRASMLRHRWTPRFARALLPAPPIAGDGCHDIIRRSVLFVPQSLQLSRAAEDAAAGRRLRRDGQSAPGLSARGAGARLLQARQSAIRALRRARFQPRRQAREHPVPLSAARPDRAGHDDARCRRAPALHPPPDAARRRGAARRPLAGLSPTRSAGCCGTARVTGWNEGDHLAKRRGGRRLRPRRDGRGDRGRSRPLRAGHRRQRTGPRRIRPLGRADLRVRERAVLRPGPHRSPDLAHGKQGSDPPQADRSISHSGMRRSFRFCRICSSENPSAKNRSATSTGTPRIRPSLRNAATSAA